MIRRRLCGGAFCIAAASGCSLPSPEADLGSARAAVVRGEPSPSGTADDGVVLLHTLVDGADVVCSGAMVAPNLVLTARHCVSYLVEGPFRCNVQGELVDNPTGAGTLGLNLPASSLEIYGAATPRTDPLARGTSILSTQSSVICLNDLAFVVLDRALELPPLPMRIGRPARKSEPVVLVGYGTSEFLTSGQTFDFRKASRARKLGLFIADVGPDSITSGVTTAAPRTIIQVGPSGCVGDSGGPLVDAQTNAVLGAYSLIDGDLCDTPTTRNFFVHVPPFTELIAQAFAAAGATPILEPVSDEEAGQDAIDSDMDASRGDADLPESAPSSAAHLSTGGCSIARHGERDEGTWPSTCVFFTVAFAWALDSACAPARRLRRRQRRATAQRRPSSGSGAADSGLLDARGAAFNEALVFDGARGGACIDSDRGAGPG